VHDFHWLVSQGDGSFVTSQLADVSKEPSPCDITFKIRHTPEYHPATLEWTGENTFIVHSREKIHGVAPGQFCVIYDSNHHRCLGSGEITV
jgi:tRNA-specific 2-thiouridylase